MRLIIALILALLVVLAAFSLIGERPLVPDDPPAREESTELEPSAPSLPQTRLEVESVGEDPDKVGEQADSGGEAPGGSDSDPDATGEDLPEDDHEDRKKREFRLQWLDGPDWGEFYKAAEVGGIWGPALQELVVERLARELSLDSEQAQELQDLVELEQAEVTEEALRIYGDYHSMRNRVANGDRELGKTLRRLRGEARDHYDPLYAETFSPEQMSVVDHHLRGTAVRMYSGSNLFVVISAPPSPDASPADAPPPP